MDGDSAGGPLPRKVGSYRLLEELGRGGMATVFLALDERRAGVHRLCAVKRLHPHLYEKKEHVEMFFDEARFASQIVHPNVGSVIDYGTQAGDPYLVMEFVCGETLRALAEAMRQVDAPVSGRSWAAIVARIAADAGAGLHAVHELRSAEGKPLDAVHRDVSPDNIILSCTGHAKLVDFGVVKAAGRQHQTESGIIKGKLAYVAPELLEGRELDRRADVWSLGVIVWELLCRRRLFRRDTDLETLRAVRGDRIDPPSAVRSDLPRRIDAVVMGALERDRTKRYATARHFTDALLEATRRTGMVADTRHVQRLMRQIFGHDATCLQRRLVASGAQAAPSVAAPEPTPITPAGRASAWTVAPPPRRRHEGVAWVCSAVVAGLVGWGIGRQARGPDVVDSQLSAVATALAGEVTIREAPVRALRIEIVDENGERLLSAPIAELEHLQAREEVRAAPQGGPSPQGVGVRPAPRPYSQPFRPKPRPFPRFATQPQKPAVPPHVPRVGRVQW